MWASGISSPSDSGEDRERPWTTRTTSAEAATPQPNDAANAIAAKPSRVALRISWSAPSPSPSDRDPEDRQRADAEQQRRGDEPLDEPAPLLGSAVDR